MPKMDALRRAKFTFSMLDEDIVAPRKTFAGRSDECTSDFAPVFILQANFITLDLSLRMIHEWQNFDINNGHTNTLFHKHAREGSD